MPLFLCWTRWIARLLPLREHAHDAAISRPTMYQRLDELARADALAFGAETSEILRLLASVVSLSSSVCRHPGIVLVTVFGYIIGRVANGSLSATQPVKG